MLRQPIEQRAVEALVHSSNSRLAFMTRAEDLAEQLRAGLRKRHKAELNDNEELDGGTLSLELELTPLVARPSLYRDLRAHAPE